MSEAKHTDGKWQTHAMHPVTVKDGTATVHHDQPIECWPVKSVRTDDQGRRITTYIAQVLRCGAMTDAEMGANARLIAAGPDLLEAAMRTVEENLHLADGEDCTLRHLKAAIRRAKGETE